LPTTDPQKPAATDKPSVLRETDDDARKLARVLLRSARYVALAVVDPQTGFPSVSRVVLGTDVDGVPVILVSGLSAHTLALDADPRCSLMAGEPGKGDPLAHPRLTVQCLAERIRRDDPMHHRLRTRFLARHPKTRLYIDFPDFGFFRLEPQAASLNGGFGRAYAMPGTDLVIRFGDSPIWVDDANQALQDLALAVPAAATYIAVHLYGVKTGNWRFCGVDAAGIDLICGDKLLRHEFATPILIKSHLINHISKIANIAYPIP